MKKTIPFLIFFGIIFALLPSLIAQISYSNCNNSGGTNANALGSASMASGNYSFAFGLYTNASAENSYSFGSGLLSGRIAYLNNDTPNSFLVGFNNVPVLFAQLRSTSDMYSGDLERIGIGTKTPKTALDIEGTIRTQNLRIVNSIGYIGNSLTISSQSDNYLSEPMQNVPPLLTLKDHKIRNT